MSEYTTVFNNQSNNAIHESHTSNRVDSLAAAFDIAFSYSGYQGVILHGRRQVGKSWFLKRYCSHKQHIYFSASRDMDSNVSTLREAILNFCGSSMTQDLEFKVKVASNLYVLLCIVFEMSINQKLLFVIDEFNYLAEDGTFDLSVFKNIIDKYKDSCSLNLVLCGSNSGILSGITEYDQPLYGRFIQTIEMKPISFKESVSVFSRMSDILDKIKTALVCSGMLQIVYRAAIFDSFVAFMQNISSGVYPLLSGMVNLLLSGERIDRIALMHIVEALIDKPSTADTLFSKVQDFFSREEFNSFIAHLENIRLVRLKPCIASKHLKGNTQIALADAILSLEYRYHKSPEDFLRHIQDKNFNDYFGPLFENFSSEFLVDMVSANKFFSTIGYWEDKVNDQRHEADVVIKDDSTKTIYIAECKFTNRPRTVKDVVDIYLDAQCLDCKGYTVIPSVIAYFGFEQQAIQKALELGVVLYSDQEIATWLNK